MALHLAIIYLTYLCLAGHAWGGVTGRSQNCFFPISTITRSLSECSFIQSEKCGSQGTPSAVIAAARIVIAARLAGSSGAANTLSPMSLMDGTCPSAVLYPMSPPNPAGVFVRFHLAFFKDASISASRLNDSGSPKTRKAKFLPANLDTLDVTRRRASGPSERGNLSFARSSLAWAASLWASDDFWLASAKCVSAFVARSIALPAVATAPANSWSEMICRSEAYWAICDENSYSPTMPATTRTAKKILANLCQRFFSRNGRRAYSPSMPMAKIKVDLPAQRFADLTATSSSSFVINPHYTYALRQKWDWLVIGLLGIGIIVRAFRQ